jgi:hypothetical protein
MLPSGTKLTASGRPFALRTFVTDSSISSIRPVFRSGTRDDQADTRVKHGSARWAHIRNQTSTICHPRGSRRNARRSECPARVVLWERGLRSVIGKDRFGNRRSSSKRG